MPAVKLVNIAPSDPLGGEAEAFLHQKHHDGGYGWKPLPRDPTASEPCHHLGPAFTTFGVPVYGCAFDAKAGRMVERDLTPDDQSRLIRHDWAMHSDCATPAFVLPENPGDKADVALASAVAARFNAKAPDAGKAELVAKAFQVAGKGDRADAVHAYYERAVGLECRVWLPGDEGTGIPDSDLIVLLAAQEQEHWEEILSRVSGPTALLLNGGRDSVFNQHHSTGAQNAAYNYISLSANATTPAAGDTTLTGEITTGGGGLYPGQATYAHTNGTSTDTLTKTHTANGSDSLPVTIAQVGVRNASAAGGTLGTKTLLSNTATLSASGDALTTTMTTTLTPS